MNQISVRQFFWLIKKQNNSPYNSCSAKKCINHTDNSGRIAYLLDEHQMWWLNSLFIQYTELSILLFKSVNRFHCLVFLLKLLLLIVFKRKLFSCPINFHVYNYFFCLAVMSFVLSALKGLPILCYSPFGICHWAIHRAHFSNVLSLCKSPYVDSINKNRYFVLKRANHLFL